VNRAAAMQLQKQEMVLAQYDTNFEISLELPQVDSPQEKNQGSFQWIFGSIWVNSHSYFGAPGPLGPAEVYPCDPVGLQMLTAAVAETQFFKWTLIEDISLRHFLHRGGLATAATE